MINTTKEKVRDRGPFAKLLDFGLSRRATHNATIAGGTRGFPSGIIR